MDARRTVLAGGVAVLAVAALLWWRFHGGDAADPARHAAEGDERGAAAKRPGGAGSAPRPASLAGKVESAEGEGLAAVVQLRAADGEASRAVRAGADGRFELGGIEPGTYRVSAAAPGYRPAFAPAITLAAGEERRVDLTLEPGGNPVRGRVVDISGGPVAGAHVSLTPIAGVLSPRPEKSFASLSDADGRFVASADDGVYVLEARHPDYVANSRRVEVRGGARELEIALVPGGVIEGVVLGARSGEPVAGAAVRYSRSTLMRLPGRQMLSRRAGGGAVVADASGRFRIAGLAPGVVSLEGRGGGMVSREPVEISMGIAENRSGVEVYVDRGFVIRGKVAGKSGAAVAGADVTAEAEGTSASAQTDEAGAFEIGPLAPGHYNVFASGGDILGGLMRPKQVAVEDADVEGVVLTVDTGVTIRGRVEPATLADVSVKPGGGGRPVGFMMLGALGGKRTGDDGRFEIGPLPPGQHLTLEALAADGRRGEAEVDVSEGAGEVVIELGEAAAIAGRVTDQRGDPVAGVFVAARSGGAARSRVIVNGAEISGRRSATDADGRYQIAGLDGGPYEISVTDAQGQALAWARGRDKAAPVDVELGEREKRTLDLSVEAPDAELRGVVVGPDGSPAADVFVTATPSRSILDELGPGPRRRPTAGPREGDEAKTEHSESREMTMVVSSDGDGGGALPLSGSAPPVVTDSRGRFVISGLRAGTYDLVAEGLAGTARGFADKVETGKDSRIELFTLTALEGEVTLAGKPVTDFSVELSGPARYARSFRSDDGRFTIRRLDPGHYTLEVRGQGGEAETEVDVAAGENTEVAVALQAQLHVRGRLVDGDGAPVADAMILVTPAQPDGEVSISITSSSPPPRTGADGRFVTAALPGKYTLLALSPGAPRPLARKSFELGADVDLGDIAVSDADEPD